MRRSTYFGAATPILPFTSSISISVSELSRLAGESLFPCLLALQCKARLRHMCSITGAAACVSSEEVGTGLVMIYSYKWVAPIYLERLQR